MDLCQPFLNAYRTIVTDNFFTSSKLGLNLMSKNTYLLGTIRKNRIGNPKNFLNEDVEV
jgi:hypothetical protein